MACRKCSPSAGDGGRVQPAQQAAGFLKKITDGMIGVIHNLCGQSTTAFLVVITAAPLPLMT
jgi:hypothetical protein